MQWAGAVEEGVTPPPVTPELERQGRGAKIVAGGIQYEKQHAAFTKTTDRTLLQLFGCLAAYKEAKSDRRRERAIEDFYGKFAGLSDARKQELLQGKVVGGVQTLWDALQNSGFNTAYTAWCKKKSPQ